MRMTYLVNLGRQVEANITKRAVFANLVLDRQRGIGTHAQGDRVG